MLYSRLSNEELERLVYIAPGDAGAQAELLHRAPDLMDQNDADLEEAREQLIADEHAHSREIEELKADAETSDKLITQLQAENAELRDRIAAGIEKLEADAAIGDEVIARLRGENNNLRNRIADLTHAEDLL